jgi:hypothetical protein
VLCAKVTIDTATEGSRDANSVVHGSKRYSTIASLALSRSLTGSVNTMKSHHLVQTVFEMGWIVVSKSGQRIGDRSNV